MKKLSILSGILITALLSGCKKEIVPLDKTPVITDASARPSGSPAPSILQWQQCLGSTFDDFGNAIAKSTDGSGYFVTGYTIDIHGNHDVIVSKIDLNGMPVPGWNSLPVGGAGLDAANGIVSTPDGGCLVAGYSNSNDGDITTAKGGGDVLLIKLSASGGKEWIKTIGGSGYDRAYALISTSDGGYALTGNTTSTDGDVTNSQVINGIAIVWLVKFNIATVAPVIDWQKTIGVAGTKDDVGYALVQAAENGYTIAGRTLSADNIPKIWVINTDNLGVVNWDKILTSSTGDVAFSVAASADINNNITGYVVTGYVSYDLVVVKYKLDGSIDWQKVFSRGSTSGQIHGRSVVSTLQGDIIVGSTNSKNGNINTINGGKDLFVLRLNDLNGNKISSNVLGGKNDDEGKAVISTTNGGYIAVGNTGSNNGNVSGNHGGSDMWVVNFKF